ncbi:hypothetical protein DL766_006800 [Monosporascus sp. MC13-8B]|uniref:Uncharacterized protein n=1 Tax=Monosporascus cannonballus TaxID=155416 RepID=A0ABY0GWR8_9PEZI|nr:hypothetical protein DL763_009948 [Monosporascus cannonballus]RYO78835.1 hypothetical protein DL762_008477 [Monosporascus cannonballus]RYP26127.1 hypothetical protein DL766_006800 [Monosporascus sp. MC13-8B]
MTPTSPTVASGRYQIGVAGEQTLSRPAELATITFGIRNTTIDDQKGATNGLTQKCASIRHQLAPYMLAPITGSMAPITALDTSPPRLEMKELAEQPRRVARQQPRGPAVRYVARVRCDITFSDFNLMERISSELIATRNVYRYIKPIVWRLTDATSEELESATLGDAVKNAARRAIVIFRGLGFACNDLTPYIHQLSIYDVDVKEDGTADPDPQGADEPVYISVKTSLKAVFVLDPARPPASGPPADTPPASGSRPSTPPAPEAPLSALPASKSPTSTPPASEAPMNASPASEPPMDAPCYNGISNGIIIVDGRSAVQRGQSDLANGDVDAARAVDLES